LRCPACLNQKLYSLANGYKKCAVCKKKFSPEKRKRENAIVECFCQNKPANLCAKELGVHYLTVEKRYRLFRQIIARFMQDEFDNKTQTIAFEEYIYLPRSKRGKKEAIFDGINFLTFNYDQKIYNILMPDLTRYKTPFLADGLEEVYYKEFERFLRYGKIQSNSVDPLIRSFWDYFEEFLLQFKGIKKENFFFYLKEAEFRFNFDCLLLKKLLEKEN
jgi:transposase-like protein